ncbi:hypothetical protein WKY82_00390 [Gordonia malaquae]
MRFYTAADYTADRPWGALDLPDIGTATVWMHWTDQPYVWCVNDRACPG